LPSSSSRISGHPAQAGSRNAVAYLSSARDTSATGSIRTSTCVPYWSNARLSPKGATQAGWLRQRRKIRG
jgi:hypothetical protein